MTIALLTPTRARPAQFKRMCDSVLKTASKIHNVKIYSGSNGCDDYVQHQFPIDCPTVYMWNELAKEAMLDKSKKLFMLCADDVIFSTPLWDEALIDHYNSLENKIHVYSLQDSRDPNGTPHVIVSREYVEAMGYFIPPIFLHWFVDTWTVDIANSNKCFKHLKNYLLMHDKPSDKGNSDDTHNRIRRMGWHERDKMVNDTCQHFLAAEKRRICEIIEARNAA